MELSQWQNTLSVDLSGPFLICRAYLRALRSAPETVKVTASIIFIGSTAGKFGEANHGDYVGIMDRHPCCALSFRQARVFGDVC